MITFCSSAIQFADMVHFIIARAWFCLFTVWYAKISPERTGWNVNWIAFILQFGVLNAYRASGHAFHGFILKDVAKLHKETKEIISRQKGLNSCHARKDSWVWNPRYICESITSLVCTVPPTDYARGVRFGVSILVEYRPNYFTHILMYNFTATGAMWVSVNNPTIRLNMHNTI